VKESRAHKQNQRGYPKNEAFIPGMVMFRSEDENRHNQINNIRPGITGLYDPTTQLSFAEFVILVLKEAPGTGLV
jgi:hypothetical protein